MILVLPATTVEFIRNEVTSSVDLTAEVVEIAITTSGTAPGPSDWETAMWDGDGNIAYLYPGTTAAGIYDYWVRVTAMPEIPVRNSGIVQFQ